MRPAIEHWPVLAWLPWPDSLEDRDSVLRLKSRLPCERGGPHARNSKSVLRNPMAHAAPKDNALLPRWAPCTAHLVSLSPSLGLARP